MRVERYRVGAGGTATVSAVLAGAAAPAQPTAVVLAHGAGADMDHPFLSAIHTGLAAHGWPCIKFNFPYTEKKRRAPDPAPALERCFTHVIEDVQRRLQPAQLVIGGKSLGGRMATHLAAQGAAVAGVLLLGYPLHPPNQPQRLRSAHLGAIRVPMLFFCGTRDALCRLDLLRTTLATLTAPVQLHVIEGGDHSFNVPKSQKRAPQDVWNEIVEVSANWLAHLP